MWILLTLKSVEIIFIYIIRPPLLCSRRILQSAAFYHKGIVKPAAATSMRNRWLRTFCFVLSVSIIFHLDELVVSSTQADIPVFTEEL